METRMKYWLGALVTGITVVLALTLPAGSLLDPLSRPYERPLQPAGERLADLTREVNRINDQLSTMRVVDSLNAVMDSADVGFVFGAPKGALARMEGRPRWVEVSEWIERNDARLAEARARLGLFLVETRPYAEGRRGADDTRAYTGRAEDGTPWCMNVVMESDGHFWFSLPRLSEQQGAQASALGPCRYWARYGPPGQSVEHWLGQGGYRFAAGDSSRATRSELRALLSRSDDLPMSGAEYDYYRWYLSAAAEACGRSDPDGCPLLRSVRDVEGHAAGARPEPRLIGSTRSWMARPDLRSPLRGILFAELERIHGREAFRRFWMSEEAVEVAFEEAFGKAMGPWVHDWTEELAGRRLAASRLRASTTFLSLLALTALIGVAVRAARRREV